MREDESVIDSDLDRVLAELRNSELLKAKKLATAVHTEEQEAAYRKGIDDLVRWLKNDRG